MVKDQEKVIAELERNNPKFIIVQKRGFAEQEAEFENERLAILKNYLLKGGQKVLSVKNFDLYKPTNLSGKR
jgi:hypothetical protein